MILVSCYLCNIIFGMVITQFHGKHVHERARGEEELFVENILIYYCNILIYRVHCNIYYVFRKHSFTKFTRGNIAICIAM